MNNADLEISIEDIDLKRLDRELSCSHTKTKMVYLSGPMFFATQGRVKSIAGAGR